MFASPIFYARDSLPLAYRGWMDWNPIAHYTEFFRAVLLGAGSVQAIETLVSLIVACTAFIIGLAVFRRLKPHFEDFL
jgi:ABC-type polysaccharide/polyol phosphate export permease